MALMHVDFFSNTLGMCVNMDVILPQNTRGQIGMEGKAEETYKTLYLLHGASDDHTVWQRRTSIERYAAEAGIAVVMPTTHLGRYTDMKYGLNYYTYIAKELPQICRDFFPRMSKKREDTFVAGLSMGGYGAIKLGLSCPETFSKAAILSGTVGAMDILKERRPTEGPFFNAYGSYEESVNTINDPYWLAKQLLDSGKELTELFIWCGKDDAGAYPQNLKFKAYMEEIGYPITYTEGPGDHSWRYWDEQIQNVIRWLLK